MQDDFREFGVFKDAIWFLGSWYKVSKMKPRFRGEAIGNFRG